MAYQLKAILYKGLQTWVQRAVHSESGVNVVLKFLREDFTDEKAAQKLRHEYNLLRELEVPGVIRALALEPFGPGQLLVLEQWGAQSLDEILTNGPLPVGAALLLGATLARTLGYVHERGILHRDVKPQKVTSFEKPGIFVRMPSRACGQIIAKLLGLVHKA